MSPWNIMTDGSGQTLMERLGLAAEMIQSDRNERSSDIKDNRRVFPRKKVYIELMNRFHSFQGVGWLIPKVGFIKMSSRWKELKVAFESILRSLFKRRRASQEEFCVDISRFSRRVMNSKKRREQVESWHEIDFRVFLDDTRERPSQWIPNRKCSRADLHADRLPGEPVTLLLDMCVKRFACRAIKHEKLERRTLKDMKGTRKKEEGKRKEAKANTTCNYVSHQQKRSFCH